MDIFVTVYSNYDDFSIEYVGTDLHKAFEATKGDTNCEVELWVDGECIRYISSVDYYASHPPHDH